MNRNDLYDYQSYSVDFLKSHPEAMLILEMGLGKTVITLTAVRDLIEAGEVRRVLIIAPLRVARNVWPAERENWEQLSPLRMAVMTGTEKQRLRALHTPADIHVINRENTKWLVNVLWKERTPWPFDMVVIDELSGFKNHRSHRWRALWEVRPFIRRIVGLTGTPAGNGLLDLWAETSMIDRGRRLGPFIAYRERYFLPHRWDPKTGNPSGYMLKPGVEDEIYGKIGDISVSMKAADYLHMPACVHVSHRVHMAPGDQEIYDEMKENLSVELDGEEITAVNAAVLCGKLLQMANGAVYSSAGDEVPVHDRKLEALEDLIEQANGQSVLIAWWYQHDHRRIRDHLIRLGYAPRDLKSDRDIADWNAGRIPVALINPASAGHGLNLQRGGHILIWFSLVWSLELYAQTNARLWRQGQEKVVTIHHILTDSTIDEAVLGALQQKETTQQRLIDAVKAELGGKRLNKEGKSI